MEEVKRKKAIEPKEHHKRYNLCMTRPPYRQGRQLKAVKVYTINDESQHLLLFGVSTCLSVEDVKKACLKFGVVKEIKAVENYPEVKEFTKVYHVQYLKLSSARFAKKKLDDMSFYGSILHVCYAPELETVEETRAKLFRRRQEVHFKLSRCKSQGQKAWADTC